MITKKMLPKNLKWIEGIPPKDEWYSDIDLNRGPLVCEEEDGGIYFVGDCNSKGGVCDCCQQYDISDVKRYAYLLNIS